MGILEVLAEEAKQEGRKEEQIAIISNMLNSTDLSVSKIASLVNVSTAFVSRVKKEIRQAS